MKTQASARKKISVQERGTLSCRIDLPVGFRQEDVLAFHRRDSAQVSEHVDGNVLQKGMIWERKPACLTIRFDGGRVLAELAIDGPVSDHDQRRLERMARRMLGLTQSIEEFERRYRLHPVIGPVIIRNSGLRVALAPTPFEALCWAITGQQISVSAAVSVRRKFIQAVGLRHSGGLYCFPGPFRIAKMTIAELRESGFSMTKAQTLLALSASIDDGALPLNMWLEAVPVDEIRARLTSIRGIGPWTVNYVLMRGFGWMDGSLHGDVAVRRNLQVLLGRLEKLGEEETKEWLAAFSPWRALVAAHLWAMQKVEGY